MATTTMAGSGGVATSNPMVGSIYIQTDAPTAVYLENASHSPCMIEQEKKDVVGPIRFTEAAKQCKLIYLGTSKDKGDQFNYKNDPSNQTVYVWVENTHGVRGCKLNPTKMDIAIRIGRQSKGFFSSAVPTVICDYVTPTAPSNPALEKLSAEEAVAFQDKAKMPTDDKSVGAAGSRNASLFSMYKAKKVLSPS